MFRGNHPAKVDEKGRLKLPSEFKRVVEEKYGSQFFITSKDGENAEIYPMKEWDRIESELAASVSSSAKKKLMDAVNYYGQVVDMDNQGRLLIPQLLRGKAQLAGDVAVIGKYQRLDVVNDERYVAKLEANPVTGEDLDALGIVGL